jgi:hypothetical protein
MSALRGAEGRVLMGMNWRLDNGDPDPVVTVPMWASGQFGDNLDCVDCGRNTGSLGICESYMVKPEVWAKTGLDFHGGCLCVRCLEKRLKRKLNKRDFSDVGMNTVTTLPRSELLQKRMRR